MSLSNTTNQHFTVKMDIIFLWNLILWYVRCSRRSV